MTDSLKFGPEWLRNLAGDGYNAGGGGTTPRYQLAEHRYGREEMLALFDRTCKAPESLRNFAGLYIKKTLLPMALIQMTEDESRLWNGGISVSTGRGRGSSVDRGGRARAGRPGVHYRGVGFDELGEGPRVETQPFPTRTRAFDRPPNERNWSERNGAADSVEWNGSISPRKELSRGVSGSSLMESNWRRHRGGGEEDDGWRMNARGDKWVKGSWRDSDKDRGEKPDGDDDKRGERWDHKGGNRAFDSHPPLLRRNRSNHHDMHDNLPEWATENPSESGGSFDASGAFHGMYSDDDEDHPRDERKQRGSRIRRVSEGNAPHSKNGVKIMSTNIRTMKNDRSLNGERPKSLHVPDTKDQHLPAEKEMRRSLSPVNSPPVPSSPSSIKPTSITKDTSSVSSPTGNSVEIRKKEKPIKQSLPEKPLNDSPQTPTNDLSSKSKTTENESPKKLDKSKSKVERTKTKIIETKKTEPRKVLDPEPKSKSSTVPQQQSQLENPQVQQSHLQQPQVHEHLEVHQQHQMPQNVPLSMNVGVIQQQTDDKQRTEAEHLNRMEEEVAKLIDSASIRDEKPVTSILSSVPVVNPTVIDPTVASVPQVSQIIQEKWFYRDPQGEVQGPFLASEMAEWHKQGYFTPNLLVRRTCDERYTTLGDLVNLCGTVPFKPGTNFPPLKMQESIIPGVSNAVPTGIPVNSAMPKPNRLDDPLLLYQYQQYRLLQNQMFLKQLRANAINKLSQSEQWATLSPVEQNQLVLQYVRSMDSEIAELAQPQAPVVPSTFIPTIPQPTPQPSNSVLQLFPQLHQVAKPQPEVVHVPAPNPHPVNTQLSSSLIDPIQQLMQQMSGMRNLPPMPQPTITPSPPQPQSSQDDDRIKSWLRQFGSNANGHAQQQTPQPQMESVWHQPPPHLTSTTHTFNAQSWMSQVGAIQPTLQPGQMPGSLWDMHPKEMKTEQQILEEQNLKMQEEKKLEELRKKEELERQQAEQERIKRQQEEELARLKAAEEAAKREEVERKKREEEKKKREEEKRRKEEEQRKLEEKHRKEEEKKREEKRKHDEEVNRKKQEEEKKKREEQKRQEEKLRKEEEKRKKLEEEQRKLEEERLRKEEEARKKAEAEEQARKAEQRRREAEALRKLQERSKAPWAQAPPAAPPTAQASLADIQRLEKEKKAEDMRLQQLLQQQILAQQKAVEAAQEALADSAKRLQFKWAEKAAPINNVNQVKSLAQIQQEEQERVAKVKHQERERYEKEKANQKEVSAALQNVSIWGTASHSLSWSNTSNSSRQTYGSSGGFWDDPIPKVNAIPSKTVNVVQSKLVHKQQLGSAKSPNQQQQQQQQNNKTKNKSKKEEELVKKLFEQNTAKTDDFTQWCNKTLSGLQVSVDIPTFIGFLRDIEAAYEVKEYVRMYLGDGKQCSEFAKQFLEKRSKWKSSQRPQTQADDLCKPAPAVNPNTSTEFQEVKSKSKKPKKGKMFKVDNKLLGFSVMSASDRINVGDRDFAEDM